MDKCPACSGRGYKESPPFVEWIDDETRTFSTIKVRCKICKGTGSKLFIEEKLP